MTYFAFLGIFLVIPTLILLVLIWRRNLSHNGKPRIPYAGWIIALHVLLAVLWTTPWDNYLVATNVWWYDAGLVTGLTIGYVPIEEYTFFVLQPIMTGLWVVFLLTSGAPSPIISRPSLWQLRSGLVVFLGMVLLAATGLLLAGAGRFTYLGLELVWALPPLIIQVGFGADILQRRWRFIVFAIFSVTFYLSVADAIAISAGTWTIDPAQSTGILFGGILPVEEILFFLLTNMLIVFGITLALADESKNRLRGMVRAIPIRRPWLDSQIQ